MRTQRPNLSLSPQNLKMTASVQPYLASRTWAGPALLQLIKAPFRAVFWLAEPMKWMFVTAAAAEAKFTVCMSTDSCAGWILRGGGALCSSTFNHAYFSEMVSDAAGGDKKLWYSEEELCWDVSAESLRSKRVCCKQWWWWWWCSQSVLPPAVSLLYGGDSVG